MSSIPKSAATLNSCFLPKDAKALADKHSVNMSIGSTGGLSLRFDFPTRALADGTKVNRVRITPRDDGTVDVHLQEIVEHDLIGGVQPDAVKALFANVLQMEI